MTKDQLQILLAKQLPDKIEMRHFHPNSGQPLIRYWWIKHNNELNEDGWLYVCQLIDKKLTFKQREAYLAELFNLGSEPHTEVFATWLEKGKALIHVLGVKV